MSKNKFPSITKKVYQDFVFYLIEFGISKSGVARAHTKILQKLGIDDTKENRSTVAVRLRKANPNYDCCDPMYRELYETGRSQRIDKLFEKQDDRRAIRRDRIAGILEYLETSICNNCDDTQQTLQLIAELNRTLANERKEDEYEAKVHGIYGDITVAQAAYPNKEVSNEAYDEIASLPDWIFELESSRAGCQKCAAREAVDPNA